MSNTHLNKEVDNAMRINELRKLIKFLVENGMFSNTVIKSVNFEKALIITDEQKQLDNPQGQLWSRTKETK